MEVSILNLELRNLTLKVGILCANLSLAGWEDAFKGAERPVDDACKQVWIVNSLAPSIAPDEEQANRG